MAQEHGWTLETPDGVHRVTTRDTGLRRVVRWEVDGEVVAERTTSDEKVVLAAADPELGAVGVRCSLLGGPRRVTWFGPGTTGGAEVAAHAGLGGLDLDPDSGTPAARREARARRHPRLYAVRHVVGGAGTVVVPLLVVWLLAQVTLPSVDLPSLPSLPLPDLPDLPLPSVGLPDVSLPGWVGTVRDAAKYVVPVLFGVVLAVGEVRRRRRQDELKARLREGGERSAPTP